VLVLAESFSVKWQGNLTLSTDYSFRLTTLESLPVTVYNTLYFSSLNLSSSDGLYGSIYTPGYLSFNYVPPSTYLAFFRSSSSWTDGKFPINGSVSRASGYVAASYLTLDEVNSTGFVFQTVNLSILTWNLSQINSIDGLSYAVFTGTPAGSTDGFSVKILAITSNVVGILNTGVVMTPQLIEISLEIYNFPYLDRTHSVQLSMGLVAATANVSTNATIWLNSDRQRYQYGISESAVYFDISRKALCDNKQRTVEIRTPDGTLNDLHNSFIQTQVESMADATYDVVIKHIIFPPGIVSITYDPTIGTGPGPSLAEPESDTSWSKKLIATLTVLGLMGVFVLAATLAYLVRLRKQMARGVEMKKQTYSPLET